RRAAVSSFGVSGTNGHVILEQAPPPKKVSEDGGGAPALGTALAWVLSARTAEALRDQAAQLAPLARDPEISVVDIGWSLVMTRGVLERHAVLVGETREELVAALDAVASGALPAAAGRARTAQPTEVVLVFPGQGSQWPGMAVELLDHVPAFAQ